MDAEIEQKVEKITLGTWKLLVAIIVPTAVIVFSVVGLFYQLKYQTNLIESELKSHENASAQMQNIKDNDLHTIEGRLQQVLDNQTKLFESVAVAQEQNSQLEKEITTLQSYLYKQIGR